MSVIDFLPNEILYHTLGWVPVKDLKNISLVNRRFAEIVRLIKEIHDHLKDKTLGCAVKYKRNLTVNDLISLKIFKESLQVYEEQVDRFIYVGVNEKIIEKTLNEVTVRNRWGQEFLKDQSYLYCNYNKDHSRLTVQPVVGKVQVYFCGENSFLYFDEVPVGHSANYVWFSKGNNLEGYNLTGEKSLSLTFDLETRSKKFNISFSPNGRWMLTRVKNGSVCLFDLSLGENPCVMNILSSDDCHYTLYNNYLSRFNATSYQIMNLNTLEWQPLNLNSKIIIGVWNELLLVRSMQSVKSYNLENGEIKPHSIKAGVYNRILKDYLFAFNYECVKILNLVNNFEEIVELEFEQEILRPSLVDNILTFEFVQSKVKHVYDFKWITG